MFVIESCLSSVFTLSNMTSLRIGISPLQIQLIPVNYGVEKNTFNLHRCTFFFQRLCYICSEIQTSVVLFFTLSSKRYAMSSGRTSGANTTPLGRPSLGGMLAPKSSSMLKPSYMSGTKHDREDEFDYCK